MSNVFGTIARNINLIIAVIIKRKERSIKQKKPWGHSQSLRGNIICQKTRIKKKLELSWTGIC